MAPAFDEIAEAAARAYLAAGRGAYHFVRSKLKFDPFFEDLLRTRTIADGACVLDLGCGHAIVAALLLAARERYEAGQWPALWPVPPRAPRILGFEVAPAAAARARTALGHHANIQVADLREATFPQADLILLIDVLHYLDGESQERVLDKAVAALLPGGSLVLRIANPSAGWKFHAGRAADHLGCLVQGRTPPRHHHRHVEEWREILGERGLDARVAPATGKASFANVLLQANA